jgi:hypothetical protein
VKDLFVRLFEPRFPARYIGRHRAPSVMLMLSSARPSRTGESARTADATV